jgi:hypothetical protein
MKEASRDTRTPRWAILLVALLAIGGFLVLWFILGVITLFHCGGDGGSPYAAEDSTVGDLCDLRDDTALGGIWAIVLLAAPIGLAVGALAALRARRWRPLALGGAVSALLLGLATLPFLALSSNCSDEDQAAYDRWLEQPIETRDRTPPADCDTY